MDEEYALPKCEYAVFDKHTVAGNWEAAAFSLCPHQRPITAAGKERIWRWLSITEDGKPGGKRVYGCHTAVNWDCPRCGVDATRLFPG